MLLSILFLTNLLNAQCRIRREVNSLTTDELSLLIRGFKMLYNTGILERLSNKHYNLQFSVHGCAQFLPFHNTFLYDLETELHKYNSNITLPYWNWTLYADSPFNDPSLNFFGDFYDKRINNCVTTGNFANWTFNGNCFKREFNNLSGNHLSWRTINNLVYTTDSFTIMTQNLEALHSFLHVWVSGDMTTHRSPNDPLFYLHHAFVDKIWFDWRNRYTNYTYGWKNNDNTPVSFNNTISGYNITVLDVLSNKNCVTYIDQNLPSSNIATNFIKIQKSNFIISEKSERDIKNFLKINYYDNDTILRFLNEIHSNI